MTDHYKKMQCLAKWVRDIYKTEANRKKFLNSVVALKGPGAAKELNAYIWADRLKEHYTKGN